MNNIINNTLVFLWEPAGWDTTSSLFWKQPRINCSRPAKREKDYGDWSLLFFPLPSQIL